MIADPGPNLAHLAPPPRHRRPTLSDRHVPPFGRAPRQPPYADTRRHSAIPASGPHTSASEHPPPNQIRLSESESTGPSPSPRPSPTVSSSSPRARLDLPFLGCSVRLLVSYLPGEPCSAAPQAAARSGSLPVPVATPPRRLPRALATDPARLVSRAPVLSGHPACISAWIVPIPRSKRGGLTVRWRLLDFSS